jgi:hypothetical protein
MVPDGAAPPPFWESREASVNGTFRDRATVSLLYHHVELPSTLGTNFNTTLQYGSRARIGISLPQLADQIYSRLLRPKIFSPRFALSMLYPTFRQNSEPMIKLEFQILSVGRSLPCEFSSEKSHDAIHCVLARFWNCVGTAKHGCTPFSQARRVSDCQHPHTVLVTSRLL